MMNLAARPMRRVLVALVGVALAACALALTGPFSRAHAATDGVSVEGSFNFHGALVVGCPTGAVLCTHGAMTGGVHGNFTLVLLTLVPSVDPGIDYFTGQLTLTSTSGKLICTLDGALNETTKGEGEFGEICVIKSGTGSYAGASGDLRLIGTSTTSQLIIPTGSGIYQGKIKR